MTQKESYTASACTHTHTKLPFKQESLRIELLRNIFLFSAPFIITNYALYVLLYYVCTYIFAMRQDMLYIEPTLIQKVNYRN